MTDIQILYNKITSDRSLELDVQEQALKDEYAFVPYVDNTVKHVDYGDVELQNINNTGKQVTPSNPLSPGGHLPRP